MDEGIVVACKDMSDAEYVFAFLDSGAEENVLLFLRGLLLSRHRTRGQRKRSQGGDRNGIDESFNINMTDM